MLQLNTANVALTHISNTKNLLVGLSTRKISRDTIIAHQLASASMCVLSTSAKDKIQERRLEMLRTYHNCQNGHEDIYDDYDSSNNSDNDDSDDDKSTHTRLASIITNSPTSNNNTVSSTIISKTTNTTNIDTMMNKLMKEIVCQRKVLTSTELELFDRQWGIDINDNFNDINNTNKNTHNDNINNNSHNDINSTATITTTTTITTEGNFVTFDDPSITQKKDTYNIISKQLRIVEEEVLLKSEKLRIATNEHIGMEILHLFITDLLGRITPAAIIFKSKTYEDFEHTEVVTKNSKRFAMIALFGINIFFIYFAILTGFRRGLSWQKSYLIACIIQFFVEIILNETLECIWIQCLIPMIVSDEVRKVGDSITEIIVDLCSTSSQNKRIFLNAPDYLFISTNVAKKFPNLMESIVIQSYFSHIPGELSKLWKNNNYNRIRQYNHNQIWINNIKSLTTILSLLQYFGTFPIILHKLFIRFIQPFLLGGLTLIWSIIITNTIYIIITCSVFIILISCSIYQYIRNVSTKSSNKLCLITPMINEVHDKNDVIDDNNDFRNEIIPIIHLDMREFEGKQDNSGSDDDYNIDFDYDEAVSEDDDEDDKEEEVDDDDEKSFDNINTDQTIEANDDESDNNCESPRISSNNTVSSINIEEVSGTDNSEVENGVSDSDEEDDDNDGGGDDDESCIDSGGDYNRRGKGREHNNNYSLLRDKSHEKNDQKDKSDDNNNNNYSSNNSNSSTTMSSSCYNDWITDDMYAEMLKEITTIHERERKDY